MKIVFEPFSGLGNRMRALDSVLPLARKFGAQLRVLWPLYRDLNCRFEDLFEVPETISKIDAIGWGVPERLRVLAHHLSSEMFIDQARMSRLIDEHYDFEDLARHSTVFIKTYSRFHESPPLYRDFVPVAPLRRIIDRQRLDERFVGVHIRRGDNDVSTAESPFDLFVEHMKREIEIDPAVAEVDREKCSGCGECLLACPYNAIERIEGKAQVNIALCKGCGTCVGACLAKAITGHHFTDQELIAQIEGIFEREPMPIVV